VDTFDVVPTICQRNDCETHESTEERVFSGIITHALFTTSDNENALQRTAIKLSIAEKHASDLELQQIKWLGNPSARTHNGIVIIVC
jgi:hypothetical protein